MKLDCFIRKIIKNAGVVLCGNSMASALNLVSFALLAKQIGPESLAVLVLAQTYSLIINDIFNIQTWESMIKFGSGSLKDQAMLNVIRTNFVLDLISAIVAACVALLCIKPVVFLMHWDVSPTTIFYLYSVSILLNITTFTIGIPRLFDKFTTIAKIQVSVAVVKLGAIILAIVLTKSPIIFFYIYFCGESLVNLFLILFSLKLLRITFGTAWWKHKFTIDKEQVRFIWWTNLRTIARIPVRHFDMIVISSVLSLHLVGVYKVYKEIAGFIGRIGDPVNQSIFPEFARLIAKNDLEKTVSIAKTTILLMTGLCVVLVFLLSLSSKLIVSTFFGAEYLLNIDVLYYLIFLYGLSFLTVPINSLFIAAGFAKYSFWGISFSNVVYLFTAFVLGQSIGIYGIVIAYAVQLVFNKGFKLYFLKKYSASWGTVR